MGAPSLSSVRPDERPAVLATLVLAFATDPVERWLYPEPRRYLAHFPDFVAAFAGAAFEKQTVWRLGELPGVAVWLPPGAEPDAATIVAVLSQSVAPAKHPDLLSVLDQMEAAHPAYPHWYLPWFGVDPAAQGSGLGTRLLESCLATVDASHLPAYLETPNPRNISFYERQDFAVTGAAEAGACPPVTFMLRSAR